MDIKKYQRLVYTVLFVSLLFIVFEISGLRAKFSLDFVKEMILMHPISGLLIFVFLFSLGNLIQIPGIIFLAAAVLALGQTMGGIVTYLAAVISCALTFFVIHTVGGNALGQLKQPFVTKILMHLNSMPIRSVIILRTILQTAPALNYTLAISGITFRQYMLGTLLGLPVPIMLYCVFFDRLAIALNIK